MDTRITEIEKAAKHVDLLRLTKKLCQEIETAKIAQIKLNRYLQETTENTPELDLLLQQNERAERDILITQIDLANLMKPT